MATSLGTKSDSTTKALVGGIIILLVLLSWLIYQKLDLAREPIEPGPVIVHQVREVSELTTAMFEMDTVVPISEKWGLSESKLLYIAHGSVRVGVELEKFQADDVQVKGSEIIVTLPPLQVLDSKLDLDHSSVYAYDRGFLGWGPDVVNLQAQAQREALRKVEESACQGWLIKVASDRVQKTVDHLLTQALGDRGYKVTVESQPPSEGSCIKSNV